MNKDCKIGFIGCGKMGSAIIKGLVKSGYLPSSNLKGSEINQEQAQLAKQRLQIDVISDNKTLVKDSDVIFLATKPQYIVEVLTKIKNYITKDKLIVSIAAGVSTAIIENIIGNQRVIRVMPNTPAIVLEGMSGVCKGKYAKDNDIKTVIELLSNVGQAIEVDENQIDIVTAISGSGPAYFYKIIEDISRAGEKLGLDYEKSLQLTVQTAIGAAKMVLQRGELPLATLIDNVATKGGCTFVGISTMNTENSDKLFYDVISKTAQKAYELGK